MANQGMRNAVVCHFTKLFGPQRVECDRGALLLSQCSFIRWQSRMHDSLGTRAQGALTRTTQKPSPENCALSVFMQPTSKERIWCTPSFGYVYGPWFCPGKVDHIAKMTIYPKNSVLKSHWPYNWNKTKKTIYPKTIYPKPGVVVISFFVPLLSLR